MVLFSIITPTHNSSFLPRLFESIKKQTYKNYEWVIVPNNGVIISNIPNEPWIKIIPYTQETKKIGEIKKFSFLLGSGDYLLEVDHDDELLPNCLEELEKAINLKNPDFIYSDSLNINADGKPVLYNPNNGWKTDTFNLDEKEILYCKSFPPHPLTFSKIWYAPNHIRAWKSSFYRSIGGHDVELKALDDQDLISRSYIHGSVYFIRKPLYIYHIHDSNSFSSEELNSWIQTNTIVLYRKYIQQLYEKWCSINNYLMIDLCGATDKFPGYINVDKEHGDFKIDLNITPWPIKDNSVGFIRAFDALEHMKDPVATMKEIHRILVPGGMLFSRTPSTDGRGAFQDPTHVSFWNSNSFWYYTREQAKFIGTPVRFQDTYIENLYPSDWHKHHLISYVEAHLTALKGNEESSYCPGVIRI